MKLTVVFLVIIGVYCIAAAPCMPRVFKVQMEEVKGKELFEVSANYRQRKIVRKNQHVRKVYYLNPRKVYSIYPNGTCTGANFPPWLKEALRRCVPGTPPPTQYYVFGSEDNRLSIEIYEYTRPYGLNLRQAYRGNIPIYSELFSPQNTLQSMHISYNFTTSVDEQVFDVPTDCLI